MQKTDKVLRLKSKLGHTLQVVREHYVRPDVPCQSSLCLASCQNIEGTLVVLPGNDQVTHYVVPDCQAARDYLEILEFPEITGIIFMQTTAHSVQHEGGRRLHNRLKNLVKDVRKASIVFHNEFQQYAYCARQAGETLQQWQARSVYEAAVWYYHHLAAQMPIVMLSNNPQVIAEYGSKNLGVFVLSVQDYLKNFWQRLTAAHDLYESLSAALQEARSTDHDYTGYMPMEVLESGIKSGRYIQGSLQVNKHNAQLEAFVRRTGVGVKDDSYDSDVLIHGMAARNRAIHGDIVIAELLPKSQWKGRTRALRRRDEGVSEAASEDSPAEVEVMPTAVVVGVLQHNWRDYVASFAQDEESKAIQKTAGKVLVIPWDYRIPKIRVSTRQAEALRDHRIIVRIDSWDTGSMYPNGHFVRSLGKVGELETEIAALLVENDLSVGQFSEGQMKELPTNSPENPWTMEQTEVSRRRDLRNSHLVFSIDPKGCEDVDDTLSIRKLPNGNMELGVHIADVSYFVKPNSLTDLEARSRSTTVYLADRRYDMLPGILSADLCSLISGVDRYAMSVVWELDDNYEVVAVWYGRTVIKSSYKLFYEIAQALHEGQTDTQTLVDNIPELQGLERGQLESRLKVLTDGVSSLMDVARHLKAKRTVGGALELEGVEVQVQLDDSKKIEDLVPKQPLEVHETIAECMIFANHWVAKKISQAFPNQALLRHHPMPRQEHFDQLVKCAEAKGFYIDTFSNKALAESLDKCVDTQDPVVNKLLRSLATQAMSNAQYFSTGSLARDHFFHYGLALDRYTHFTSPIRRYADVVVHRLLLAAVGVDDGSQLIGNTDLQQLSQHINTKHRAAQHAQKDSQELFQALFFKDHSPDDPCCIVDGVIFQLRANGVLVFIPRYGMRGPLYLKSREGQVIYTAPDHEPEWVGGSLSVTNTSITVNSVLGSHTYHLFDHITVRISLQQSHAHMSSIRLQLLSNKPHTTFDEATGQETSNQKTDIVKEVTSTEGQKEVDNLDLGSNFQELKSQYGQTEEKTSFYHLLQSFRDMGQTAVLPS